MSHFIDSFLRAHDELIPLAIVSHHGHVDFARPSQVNAQDTLSLVACRQEIHQIGASSTT
jgi:hypothetical protein